MPNGTYGGVRGRRNFALLDLRKVQLQNAKTQLFVQIINYLLRNNMLYATMIEIMAIINKTENNE